MGLLDSVQFWKKKEENFDNSSFNSPSNFSPPPEQSPFNSPLPPLSHEQGFNPSQNEPFSQFHNPALPQPEPMLGSVHGYSQDTVPLGAPLAPPDPMGMENSQTSAFAIREQAPMQQQDGSFTLNSNPQNYGVPSQQYRQPPMQMQQPQQGIYEEYSPPPQQLRKQDNLLEKDLEIISMKLDYLKATLENISQRLANIERKENSHQGSDYKW
ncbi:MAG: hypothetical protein V1859_10060 [archaeon]